METRDEKKDAIKEPPQTYVALVKFRDENGVEHDGWVTEHKKEDLQNRLDDDRILEIVALFRGKKIDFTMRNVVWF